MVAELHTAGLTTEMNLTALDTSSEEKKGRRDASPLVPVPPGQWTKTTASDYSL
jgi:hypothetical protein